MNIRTDICYIIWKENHRFHKPSGKYRVNADGLLEDLVQVMLFHEVSRRRCRRRRCRGWY